MKIQTQFFAILFASFLLSACTGNNKDSTPFGKTNPGNGNQDQNNPSKPSQSMKKAALADRIYFNLETSSQLKAANKPNYVIGSVFMINQSEMITWTNVLKLNDGESANSTYPGVITDGQLEFTLNIETVSFEKNKLTYLGVVYILERNTAGGKKTSIFAAVVNPKLGLSHRAFAVKQFFYPVPEGFKLKEWAEAQIK